MRKKNSTNASSLNFRSNAPEQSQNQDSSAKTIQQYILSPPA